MNSIIKQPNRDWVEIWFNHKADGTQCTLSQKIIPLDLTKYKEVRIAYVFASLDGLSGTTWVDDFRSIYQKTIDIGSSALLTAWGTGFVSTSSTAAKVPYFYTRKVTVKPTYIEFSDGWRQVINTGVQTVTDNRCVPIRIWAR